jgi:mono/diheme cytochrome c family protein
MRWKVVIGVALTPVLGLGTIGAISQAYWDRTYDVPQPALRASLDPEVIERGRYLAYGPAHCALCHTTRDKWPAIEAGEEPPMSGGNVFDIPLGRIYAPNLTPDAQTGIGRWTDGQLARMLREGVTPDGRAALPFMAFQNMSDDDIIALISFLRVQPAVHNPVPAHEPTAIGRAVLAFLIRPKGPDGTPLVHTPAEAPTIERGAYIADHVAECAGCHSQRNLLDGSFTGPLYAGGMQMPFDDDPTQMFVTPNLTPDPETGHIYSWSEDQFVARLRAGRVHEQSHMPWGPFARMSDTDMRAIYRYLRSLEPVYNATGPIVQPTPK